MISEMYERSPGSVRKTLIREIFFSGSGIIYVEKSQKLFVDTAWTVSV